MATVKLTFNFYVNASVQVGDTVYYVDVAVDNNVSTASGYSNIVKMGDVLVTEPKAITINHDDNIPLPITSNFIMFSKDNAANLSSVLGYFANVKFVNESTDKAEIFSVGVDMFESSK